MPQRRGRGLGRALLQTAMDVARARGADHMDLGTSEDAVAARSLYESLGFINREGGPEGPITFFYERPLTGRRRRAAPAADELIEVSRF